MADEPQINSILAKVIVGFLVAVAVMAWGYRRIGARPLWVNEPRPVVPWGPGSVVGVAVLCYALLVVVSPLRDRLLATALAGVGISILTPIFLRESSGARLGDLGLTSRDLGRNLLRGAAGCALALPLVYFVQYEVVKVWTPQSHPAQVAITARSSVATVLTTVFGAIVAAPLSEEILFRGVLLGLLWKSSSRGADVAANALTSLLFASLHAAQWPAPIPLFVFSMALGEVYRRSGSLAAPIAMHVCFNALSTGALVIAILLGAAGPPN